MYKVRFYLLHGYFRDSSGRYIQETLAVNELDDKDIKTFSAFSAWGYDYFKVEYIEVVYDYIESEGGTND